MHDETVERAAAGQRVAVSLPGVERERLVPRRRARRSRAPIPSRTGWTCCSRSWTRCPRRSRSTSAPPMSPPESPAAAASPSFGSSARSSQRGETAVVLRTTTTVGGGVVLDPLPPRRVDVATARSCSSAATSAATVHEPVRASSLRHLTQGELAGVERAGEWVFSPCLARGVPRRAGGPTAEGRSARPRDRPACGAMGCGDRAAARARAARLPSVPAGTKAEAAGGEELLGELEVGRSRTRSSSPTRSSPGCSSRKESSSALGDGLAVGRGRVRARTRRRSSRSARLPAGSRSPGSETCSESGGARPSCCSSASTPTASPAGSETSASCGGQLAVARDL